MTVPIMTRVFGGGEGARTPPSPQSYRRQLLAFRTIRNDHALLENVGKQQSSTRRCMADIFV